MTRFTQLVVAAAVAAVAMARELGLVQGPRMLDRPAVGYDVAFLVDESGSVSRPDQAVQRDFVKAMASKLAIGKGPCESRLAYTPFSSKLGGKADFGADQATDSAKFSAAVGITKVERNFGTGTGTALISAYNAFKKSSAARNKVVFLLTDGAPNTITGCGGPLPSNQMSKNKRALECSKKAITNLRNIGVRVVYINLGNPTKPSTNSHITSTKEMFGGAESDYRSASYADLLSLVDPLANVLFSACSPGVTPTRAPATAVPSTESPVAQYDVAFSAKREDGSSGVSLYQPIVGTLMLSNVNAAGPLSFYITDVTVQLRAPGGTTPLASRTFTRSEKQRLMQSLSSPYYADAHYCRTVPSAGVCSSFYTVFTNPLTTASALASTFNVQGTHKSCVSSTTMNQDRFIFTPSNWGMDRFAPSGMSNLELYFVVKANMTSCASSGRRLADPDVPHVVKVVKTQALSKDACQQTSPQACAKVKSCIWTSDPTQVPAFPTCVAKSSVARWACPNILTSAACASNRACEYVKKTKKCAFKPEKIKTG